MLILPVWLACGLARNARSLMQAQLWQTGTYI